MYKKSILSLVITLLTLTSPFLASAQTATNSSRSSIQSEIDTLTSKIEQLKTETIRLSTTTLTSRVNSLPIVNCLTINRSLALGTRGSEVNTLQQFLISRGFPIEAGATGYFGTQTKNAVVMWQTKNNVVTSLNSGLGIFGPLSRGVYARSCDVSDIGPTTPLSYSLSANPKSGLAPLTVSFTASVPIANSSSTFALDFGDTSTVTPLLPGSCIAMTTIVGGQGGIRCSATTTHTYTATGTFTAKLMHNTCPAGAQCFVGPMTVATTSITVLDTVASTSNSVRLNAPGAVTLGQGGTAEIRNKSAYFIVTNLTTTKATITPTAVGCWNAFPSDPQPEIICLIAVMPIEPVMLTVGQTYTGNNYQVKLTSIENSKATFSVTSLPTL